MSVNAVAMFYGKLASDMMMQRAFAEASAACAIKFAAERGYLFTAYDLQMAGETMQGHARRVSEDVKLLLVHQWRLGAAAQAVGQVAGQAAGLSLSQFSSADANHAMSKMELAVVFGRLSEVFSVSGRAKKSG